MYISVSLGSFFFFFSFSSFVPSHLFGEKMQVAKLETVTLNKNPFLSRFTKPFRKEMLLELYNLKHLNHPWPFRRPPA